MMRFAAVSAACLMLAAPALAGTDDAPAMREHHGTGALRGIDPGTTGSVQAAPAAPPKPSCPPDRRVGTGAGFCLIN